MEFGDSRPFDVLDHPVSLRKYYIPTLSIGVLYAQINKIIRRRTSGLVIWGKPRYGKSSAIECCMQMIQADYPGVPACVLPTRYKVSPSEGCFFEDVMTAIGYANPNGGVSGSNSAKRTRIVNKMAEKAIRNKRKIYILFVDEAQRLLDVQYEWLRDIYNELALQGIQLLVILVGQSALCSAKRNFIECGKSEIVSRFMIMEMAYHGVRSEEELKGCLGSYDEICYPVESEWTFTKFFFPRAYDAGFRLANYSSLLWQAFKEHQSTLRVSQEIELPMKYFTLTVEIILTEISAGDCESFELNYLQCLEAVAESWYLIVQEDQAAMNSRT